MIVKQAVMADPKLNFTKWSNLANKLPGRKRTGRQVRDRWNNYLNPVLSQLPFTREDDLFVWAGFQKFGSKWVEIGSKVFSSSRSENQIKNRWNSVAFKKFVAREFGPNAYENAKCGRAAQQYRPEQSISNEVTAEPLGILVSDYQSGEGNRHVFVPAPPPPSFNGSMLYLNEDAKQAQLNVHWQPMWVSVVGEIRKEGGKRHHGNLDLIAKPSKRRNTSTSWTKTEERLVTRTVMSDPQVPFSRWSELANLLPGRTSKQVRDRWINYLDPAISRQPFTRDDDLILWNAHQELGNKWVDIGIQKFASKRSENTIKNRWYSVGFRKFIAKEFGQGAYENAKMSQQQSRADDSCGSSTTLLSPTFQSAPSMKAPTSTVTWTIPVRTVSDGSIE